MLLSNLHKVYIYEKVPVKADGETTIKWKYKGNEYMNDQQDVNELDKTNAGLVNFDTLKLRSNKTVIIGKNDGISYTEIAVEDGYTTTPPEYIVESMNKIGKSVLYICKSYNGE